MQNMYKQKLCFNKKHYVNKKHVSKYDIFKWNNMELWPESLFIKSLPDYRKKILWFIANISLLWPQRYATVNVCNRVNQYYSIPNYFSAWFLIYIDIGFHVPPFKFYTESAQWSCRICILRFIVIKFHVFFSALRLFRKW